MPEKGAFPCSPSTTATRSPSPYSTPITPLRGSLFHADPQIPPAVRTIEYRASIIDLVEQLNPALAITLAFNRDTTQAGAAEDLKHLHARLDRLVLGRLWAKREDDRSIYVAVIEHVDDNLHIHLALSCAPEHVDQIAVAVAGIWRDMIPTGTADVQDAFDVPGWGRYISKAITPGTCDLLLLS